MIAAYRYLVPLCLLFAACEKKPLPAPEEFQPLFSSQFDQDGIPVKFEAGVNSYSMSPYMTTDSAGRTMYAAELRPADCSGCGWKISFLLNDPKATGKSIPDSVFYTGNRVYRGKATAPVLYRCDFAPVRSKKPEPEVFRWEYLEATKTATEEAFALTRYLAPGIHTVALTYQDAAGTCDSRHMRRFKVGSTLQFSGMVTRTVYPDQYEFSCAPFRSGLDYSWSFGDGTTASGWKVAHTYSSTSFARTAVLRVVDPVKQDTCFAHYQVPLADENCHGNFNATITPVFNPAVNAAVTVLLTDPSGNVYSTDLAEQPQDSYFVVDSEAPYIFHGSTGSFRQLSIRYNCVVALGDKLIAIRNGKAHIAFPQ